MLAVREPRIVEGRGPMSDELDRRWGAQYGYFQAYDWTIYCVGTYSFPDREIIEHEKVHFRQQDEYKSVQEWWERYLDDPEFRFNSELTAYTVSIDLGRSLGSCAWALSGSLYGGVVTYEEAREALRKWHFLYQRIRKVRNGKANSRSTGLRFGRRDSGGSQVAALQAKAA